ncbi:MAG: hypothetical protein K6U02_02300 [Firmicutes bacterium]|nr:hypothetical protein [Bacillota bacterium]
MVETVSDTFTLFVPGATVAGEKLQEELIGKFVQARLMGLLNPVELGATTMV